MRVLIVADVVGGVRTFTAELLRGLDEAGVEVHLALLGADKFDRDGAASCEIRDLRLEWMDEPWRDLALTSEWVDGLRRQYAPDVIHMNTFAPVLDPDVPVLLTVHSCVLTWWRAVHGTDAPEQWGRYADLARRALNRASLLTVPTRALLDELGAVYGELPSARVIANGRSIRSPTGCDDDRLVVSAGRLWDEAKNASLIVRAARAIDGDVALIGPLNGEAADVQTPGVLAPQELLRWLRRAAVFVEPARYEPFGLTALEAALSGCALVLGDIPSLHEVWRDGAVYVDPDDADGLANAVNELLNGPGRRAFSAAAARKVACRYTTAAMARSYVNCYRELTQAAIGA